MYKSLTLLIGALWGLPTPNQIFKVLFSYSERGKAVV